MKGLRDPRLWLGLLSLGLVVALFALDYERTSPGPLSPVHAQLPELAGSRGCDRCHGGWLQSMDAACADCHQAIATQLATGAGLHGALARRAGEEPRCAACHQEHHGSGEALSGAGAFALAGFGAREGFAHDHVEFELTGAHALLACAACHEQADAEVLAAGSARFLGLDQRCTSCHEDPHGGRFARGCATCHGQERPFGELASFVHGGAFPLVGGHARPSCAACHPKDSPYEVEALAGRAPPPPARTCLDCHASPHRADFVAGVAAATALAAGATCASCHAPEAGTFAAPHAAMPAALHAASGFPLEPPHARAACTDCHAAPRAHGEDFEARFPGRGADDCASCHADPHGGQFAHGALADRVAARGCLACHAREAFEPPRFDARDHAATAFPLEGRHVEAACTACHLAPPEDPRAPRRFAGTPSDCAACHLDPHGEALDAPYATCAACHVPAGFELVDRAAFDHGAWTRFALEGAHAAASCAACHPPLAGPGVGGRTQAPAAQVFAGPPWECASCHADVHRGAFGASGAPRGSGGREGCARCHVPATFAHVEPEFEHGAWTGFALEGAHARAECASCHGPPPARDGEAARAFGFAAERFPGPRERCATCHADPHRGAFDGGGLPASVDGRAGCARCHTSESFRAVDPTGFDHGLWTGHELVGAHARAACTSCHARDGGGRLGPVRGAACADCHADPHAGQFLRGGATDCARCHDERAPTFAASAFDHQRDARFALDATHARLDCSACHLPWPVGGFGEVVRYRPLGTRCADCHGPVPGGGR